MNQEAFETRPGRVPAAAVRTAPVPVLIGGRHSPARVVPILEDGVVRYIEVHCGCGRTTVLECLYGEEEERCAGS